MPLTVPPCPELIAAPHWRTVDFISDLHLHPSEPATWTGFCHYLGTTPADALFVLGDLFEVWVGDDALEDPDSFEAQACAALQAAATRCALHFMHGNRDFLAGALFATRSGATLLHDPTVLVWNQQRLLLSHGDALCIADTEYQRFRAQVRSPAWQQAFLAQPLAARRAQARGIRAESEARKRTASSYADVDHPSAQAWLRAANATTLIHGHTHQPALHLLGEGLERIVLSDWALDSTPPRGDVLRLSDQGLERIAIAPS